MTSPTPLHPVPEPLLFSCSSRWLRRASSAVRVLLHMGESQLTRQIQGLFFAHAWFGDTLFSEEKRTCYLFIEQMKTFHSDNHNSLYFTVFSMKHIHTPKANKLFFLVTMAKPLLSNLTWDYHAGLHKYLLGSAV